MRAIILLLILLIATPLYPAEVSSSQVEVSPMNVKRQEAVLLADKDMKMLEGTVQKACPIHSIYDEARIKKAESLRKL